MYRHKDSGNVYESRLGAAIDQEIAALKRDFRDESAPIALRVWTGLLGILCSPLKVLYDTVLETERVPTHQQT